MSGPSRALVIGGGLLGGHVAAALADAGMRVTVFSRSINPWLEETVACGAPIELVRREIAATDDLTGRIEDADIVVFLAGASTPSHADLHLTSSTLDSVITALTVLDLMRQTTTRRIVLASSGGTIYGEPRQLPTDETHPLDPISMHGLNSVATERYARFFADREQFHVTILRYSNVYGPGQTGRRGQGVVAAWCRALALGEPVTVFGGLDARRDFIYVDDAAAATVAAVTEPDATGIFNVGSGVGVRLETVLDLVAATAQRPLVVEHRPARGLDVTATALDCSRLTLTTGWSPTTSLAEGVRNSWEWLSRRFGIEANAHGAPMESRGRTD